MPIVRLHLLWNDLNWLLKTFFVTIHNSLKQCCKNKDSNTMIWIILSERFERNFNTRPYMKKRKKEKWNKTLLRLTSTEIFLAKDSGLRIIPMQMASWRELNIVEKFRIARVLALQWMSRRYAVLHFNNTKISYTSSCSHWLYTAAVLMVTYCFKQELKVKLRHVYCLLPFC